MFTSGPVDPSFITVMDALHNYMDRRTIAMLRRTMKLKLVIPKLSYKLLGTDIELKAGIPHRAENATNQPDWKAKGLLFVHENGGDLDDCRCILLGREDYKIHN